MPPRRAEQGETGHVTAMRGGIDLDGAGGRAVRGLAGARAMRHDGATTPAGASMGYRATGSADRGGRVLLYSHDTYGLGHLRRSLTIAGALTGSGAAAECLIVTGSPMAGRFAYPPGVAFEHVPPVVKTAEGGYRALDTTELLDTVIDRRRAAITAAERRFAPDLVLVDKEPWGLRGEMSPALAAARGRGARIVLGLRDVLDEEDALAREWERKGALDAIERFYDEIWVYGIPAMCRPLTGLGLSPEMEARIVYAGYLRRGLPPARLATDPAPGLLVTTGGGADGAALIDWVLAAYEADPALVPAALVVYGPFLDRALRDSLDRRVAALAPRVAALDFHPRLERVLAASGGVVAMGGYNTFCEILSMDRPALVVPRTRPRREQIIRAAAAERLGLARMLDPEREGRDAAVMAHAIRALGEQAPPLSVAPPGLLDGLDRVTERTSALIAPQRHAVGE